MIRIIIGFILGILCYVVIQNHYYRAMAENNTAKTYIIKGKKVKVTVKYINEVM
jgi:hypothetical protein